MDKIICNNCGKEIDSFKRETLMTWVTKDLLKYENGKYEYDEEYDYQEDAVVEKDTLECNHCHKIVSKEITEKIILGEM